MYVRGTRRAVGDRGRKLFTDRMRLTVRLSGGRATIRPRGVVGSAGVWRGSVAGDDGLLTHKTDPEKLQPVPLEPETGLGFEAVRQPA